MILIGGAYRWTIHLLSCHVVQFTVSITVRPVNTAVIIYLFNTVYRLRLFYFTLTIKAYSRLYFCSVYVVCAACFTQVAMIVNVRKLPLASGGDGRLTAATATIVS